MVFPSRRKDVAVQAIRITMRDLTERVFTFCLEKMPLGSYKVS